MRQTIIVAFALAYAALSAFCLLASSHLPPTMLLVFLGPPLLLGWGPPMMPYFAVVTAVLVGFVALAVWGSQRRPELAVMATCLACLLWLFSGWLAMALGY